MIKNIAKVIRAVTIPPIMVLGLVILLSFTRADVFLNSWQLFLAIFFLMVVPVLAYPLSYIVPKIKSEGRDGQRNLAFGLSLLGYSLGLAYALVFRVNTYLFIVFFTYFLSVMILTIFNKIVKIKASGHSCSITGPLVLIIYFLGFRAFVWCAAVFALVIWSSLALKRHTLSELVLGSLASIVAFFVCLMAVHATMNPAIRI